MGVMVSTQRLMPQRVSELVGRLLGTGRVFTSDLQPEKRRAYARRTGTS
jgi:hypothetical protein